MLEFILYILGISVIAISVTLALINRKSQAYWHIIWANIVNVGNDDSSQSINNQCKKYGYTYDFNGKSYSGIAIIPIKREIVLNGQIKILVNPADPDKSRYGESRISKIIRILAAIGLFLILCAEYLSYSQP